MGTSTDYYEILQVSPNADEDVIQAAYRRLALKWHPGRNPGDAVAAERMQLLNEAFAILSDPLQRREYDARRTRSTASSQANDKPADTPPRPSPDPKPPEGKEAVPQPPPGPSKSWGPIGRGVRAVFLVGIFLFVFAHGQRLVAAPLIFFLTCITWGLIFGVPVYLCRRFQKHTGLAVVAALFLSAAVLDAVVAVRDRSGTNTVQPDKGKELPPPDWYRPARTEDRQTRAQGAPREYGSMLEALEAAQGTNRSEKYQKSEPGVNDATGDILFPNRATTPTQVKEPSANIWTEKSEVEQRQTRNKKRLQEIASTLEALDPLILIHSQEEWRTCTMPFRFGKPPSEFARDSLVELLVKLEMHEQGRMRLVERNAARAGLTLRDYCLNNGHPLPQDHKSGDWKKVRGALVELEY